VPRAFLDAVRLIESRARPLPSEGCEWCRYVARKGALEGAPAVAEGAA
jgi:hypothetical protein